ncbi:MAG: MATE family efflux transporter [Solobacterium sp.]|nr:MATE family efflux transporter [Solobacterium sp.]
MIQGKTYSNQQLQRLIVPLLIEQILGILVGILDTMMVSSVGEAAISGVSLVNEVNFLVIAVMGALTTGGAVVVTQYIGYGDRDYSNLAAGQLVLISFLVPAVFMTLVLLFNRQIIGTLYHSISPDVMEACIIYFVITAFSFPFLGIYNSGAALHRAMNMTAVTMRVSMLMNLINLVGNYIGIFILHIGVAGVAIPTLISRAVAAVLIIRRCFNPANEIVLHLKNIFCWRGNVIRKILSIAVPNGIENGLFQFGKVLVASIVATMGTSQIAANGVANSLGTIAYIADSAMGMAIVTVVGRCVGANDYDEARFYIRRMVFLAAIMTGCANLLLFLTLPLTLKMYTLTAEAAVLVRQIIIVDCVVATITHSVAFVLPNALRASGDARYTMMVGICSMFSMRLLGGYILGIRLGFGVIGVWYAMFLDWIIRIIFFVRRYRSGIWMNYRVVR